ncbi:MAG: hypothetical protein ACREMY_11860, partial [bacterium]
MKRSVLWSFCAAIVALLLVVSPSALEAAVKKVSNGKIAFVSTRDGNEEIYVMDPSGSGATRLTTNTQEDSEPAWSPDGTKIAFFATRNGHSTIAVMNADGSGQTVISENNDTMPSWSPDGASIAFESVRDGNHQIYVMAADGSSQDRRTFNAANDFGPRFSPDGRSIVFYSDRDGHPEIYVMKTDGTDQKRLTVSTNSQAPGFSPDGTKIVYQSAVPSPQIFLMNADGTNQVPLTTIPHNHSPVFSPDGQKIVFYSGRDASYEIYTMNADGTEQTRLTTNSFDDFIPAWQPLIPRSTIGVYRPTTGQWLLRNANSSGSADLVLTFGGQPGDLPVTGDWNGDGQTDLGVWQTTTHTFTLLAANGRTTTVSFGHAGDLPVTGDWDGDGKTDIGIFGPAWPGDPRAVADEPGLPDPYNQPTGKFKNVPPLPQHATIG